MGHIDAVASESALNEMGGYVSKYPGMLTSSFSIFRYNDDPADVDMVGFVYNTETWFVSIIADLVRRAGLPAPFGCDTPGPPFGLGPDPYNERPVTRTWRESTFSDARYYLNLISIIY
jgi:hypothetical protein